MDVFGFVQQLKKNINEQKNQVVFIGVAGGSGSGKSSITQIIKHYFKENRTVTVVDVCWFYRECSSSIVELFNGQVNYDDPFMIDDQALLKCLQQLKEKQNVSIKKYDMLKSRHQDNTVEILPADIIIVEGIFAFYWQSIRDMLRLRIYVDCCGEYRLMRRIIRDVRDRGRNCEQVIAQYHKFVKPSYDKFVQPQIRYAHLVLPWETMGTQTNLEAVELLVNYINMVAGNSAPMQSQ